MEVFRGCGGGEGAAFFCAVPLMKGEKTRKNAYLHVAEEGELQFGCHRHVQLCAALPRRLRRRWVELRKTHRGITFTLRATCSAITPGKDKMVDL